MSALDRKQEKKAGGIDVSAHNGAVDWKKVKASGVDFAVIRAGYGNTISQKDERFDENMKNALEAGLGVGIYWFSYAINPEDARKEAAVCKEVLQKWKGKFAYPVFYDFEYATETYAKEQGVTFSNSGRTDVILTFLEEMKRDYTAGYYSNPDYLTYKLEYSRLKGWPLWLAQYKAEPEWQCVLQQSSSTGRISGISGNVDTDVAYTEYALPKPEKPETGEKPETAKQYTIRAGDTLWDIAQKEKTTVGAILALNPEIKDASRIYPGQVIRLPGKTSVSQAKKTVTVKAGDTLSEIAAREGISLSEILRLNPEIENSSLIYPGQVIRIRS